MFIATANNLNTIQPALLDRMEIINISGYSTEEKVQIAKKHLLKKQILEHGLLDHKFNLQSDVIKQIIEGYTRESGVRKLEKNIAKICRWIATKIVEDNNSIDNISSENISEILGVPISKALYENNDVVGVTTGLAWTQYGGEILFIESILSPGKGLLSITGNLGKVMKESATIALEFIKSNSSEFGIDSEIFKKYNFHLHVPEGATPKDGPLA